MNRILVVAPNWIGDALMALPLIAHLKSASTPSQITVIAPPAVAEVLSASSVIDDVIPTAWGHGGLQLWSRIAFARRLAQRKFDLAVVLPNSLKSALVPFFAGIAKRVGYVGEARRGLLTHHLPRPAQGMPMVERYAALARLTIPATSDAMALPPTLSVDAAATESVLRRFRISGDRPLVVFCPGAEYGPAKRWPVAHFADLAELLQARQPEVQIVLAGAAGDVGQCEQLISQSKARITSTAGQTSMAEALALLSGASYVVSNDSGLMHVAAALGRPLLALYGSTDPRHTPPQSAMARIVWLHIECSPCFARVCPLGHFRCMNDITAESVMAVIPSVVLH